MSKKKPPEPVAAKPRVIEITEPPTQEQVNSWTMEQLQYVQRRMRGILAGRNDSPFGFGHFYFVIFGNELPEHGKRWVEAIYGAKKKDRGVLLWAFRGSWKTTTLSIAFTAFRIGHNPERANLIVQVNDDSAGKTAAAIADIIDVNPGWKMCFQNAIPDKEKGWGANGYEVKRADMEYPDWRAKNAARKDPTLLGLGYGSGGLIGKHPDGLLCIDDIHNEENTVSARERQSVVNRLTGTILPMVIEDETRKVGQRLVTWEIVVGTPWTEDDAYHYLKNTGEFEFLDMPVMTMAEKGEEGAVEITEKDFTHSVHPDLLGWWKLVWPERFSKRIIVSWRNKAGKREFARMYLLDLKASNETGLKYQLYPAERIDPRWAALGGVDYASVIEKRKTDDPGRDYFAMAYLLKVPTGGAVIADGVFEQCTQAQAESHLERAQGLYLNWINTVVEGDGKGEEFIAVVSRKPHVRIVPMTTHGKGKRARLERQLGPWMENGLLRVSDGDTPFLNALRKALDEYPNWHLDPIDGVYWAARGAPDVFQLPRDSGTEIPAATRRQKAPNPFAALAHA